MAEAINIARNEVTMITNIKGSKEYKYLLLGQLLLGHLINLAPEFK